MSTAKAWVASGVAALTALLGTWTDGTAVTARDLVVTVLAGLVAYGAVYNTPNKTS